MTLLNLKQAIAKETGIQVDKQRLYHKGTFPSAFYNFDPQIDSIKGLGLPQGRQAVSVFL
jgi:hypothetical protein